MDEIRSPVSVPLFRVDCFFKPSTQLQCVIGLLSASFVHYAALRLTPHAQIPPHSRPVDNRPAPLELKIKQDSKSDTTEEIFSQSSTNG